MIYLLAYAFLFGFLAGSIAMAKFTDLLIKRSRAAAKQAMADQYAAYQETPNGQNE